jgi:hypothetical protein
LQSRPDIPGVKLKKTLTAVPADDLAQCIDLADSAEAAQKNPENYVFFIAHMYHLFGKEDEEDPDAPWSIKENWNFEMKIRDKNPVFGATKDGMD